MTQERKNEREFEGRLKKSNVISNAQSIFVRNNMGILNYNIYKAVLKVH